MIFLRIAALLAMTKPTLATISTGNEGMTAVREMTSSYPVGMAKIAAMNFILLSGSETVVANHDFRVAQPDFCIAHHDFCIARHELCFTLTSICFDNTLRRAAVAKIAAENDLFRGGKICGVSEGHHGSRRGTLHAHRDALHARQGTLHRCRGHQLLEEGG